MYLYEIGGAHRQLVLVHASFRLWGSIDYPVFESSASNTKPPRLPHKLRLDVDLNILLPSVIEQLIEEKFGEKFCE